MSSLSHSLSHSSFPGSQLGFKPNPFHSRSELSFHSVYKGQRDHCRRNPAWFSVVQGLAQLVVQHVRTDGGATFSFTHKVFPGGKKTWGFEKLREKNFKIPCTREFISQQINARGWYEHYGCSTILILVLI